MNIRKLTNITNATISALVKSMEEMGLNLSLIWGQLSRAFQDSHIRGILDDLGLEIEGTDVKMITESFGSEMMKSGMIQRMNVTSASDNLVEITLGDCVFSQATHSVLNRADEIVPPCSMLAILYSVVNRVTGRGMDVVKHNFDPATNSCSFTINVEE